MSEDIPTDLPEEGQTQEHIGEAATSHVVGGNTSPSLETTAGTEEQQTDSQPHPDNHIDVRVNDNRESDPSRAYDKAQTSKELREGARTLSYEGSKLLPENPDDKMPHEDVMQLAELYGAQREMDQAAVRLEDWVDVFHDHPVSDSYRESHKNIDFSPKGFLDVETMVLFDIYDAEKVDELIEQFPADVGVNGINEAEVFELTNSTRLKLKPESLMKEAYNGPQQSEEDKAKLDAWQTMLKDPNTTLGQLRELYNAAFEIVYINRRLNYSHMAQSVLDDVRTGRASQ